jgi:hypothetical protein
VGKKNKDKCITISFLQGEARFRVLDGAFAGQSVSDSAILTDYRIEAWWRFDLS